ncbi:MAG: hypothetical protein ACI9UV_001793 [Algoriphagus sp.]|jgi:hypothetical protein
MRQVGFPFIKISVIISLNEKIFIKLSLIEKSREMRLLWLLLKNTAKLFNSLHLFFTPA